MSPEAVPEVVFPPAASPDDAGADAVGVLAVGVAAPELRLAARDVAAAWGAGGGKHTVAVCDVDEDTLTLACAAALDALARAGIDAAEVSGLWWATTRPPFAEGPSHAFLATALGLADTVGGVLAAGSPHAGMEALVGAWDALAAGHATTALVVASDALVPGLGTAGEAATGAGAVAWVLSAGAPEANGSGPGARLRARATRHMAVVDRYRGDAQGATGDAYDGRLFREEVFLPIVTAAGRAVVGQGGDPSVDAWSIADLDGKLAAAAARSLGGAPLSSAPVHAELGDTGAAGALLGAVPALARPGVVGIVGYGGGRATAVVIDVMRPVAGAAGALERLGGGRSTTYTEATKARGQLVPMTDPIPMGVPPASAAFVRGAREMLSLEGARCRSCGTTSTPPTIHPRCIGCGGADTEIVRLARRGTVETFVVNQTMPPPFQAPLPLIVIDLDDGARVMLQGSPADAETLGIGDTVELVLRRYAVERHIPVYGYKALRAAGTGDRVAATEGSGR